jgi:hypothetical protein
VNRTIRPKATTRTCAHCKRRRLRLKIEWHPGIEVWQCSDFDDCDNAIKRRRGSAEPVGV